MLKPIIDLLNPLITLLSSLLPSLFSTSRECPKMNTSPNRSLFVLLWNADGSSQHRHHLQTLLYDKNIDSSVKKGLLPQYGRQDEHVLAFLLFHRLDFFLTSHLPHLHPTTYTLDDLTSDHSPVFLSISTTPIPRPPYPALVNGPIDWKCFQEMLESKLYLTDPLKTTALFSCSKTNDVYTRGRLGFDWAAKTENQQFPTVPSTKSANAPEKG